MKMGVDLLLAVAIFGAFFGWLGTIAYMTISCNLYFKKAMKEMELEIDTKSYNLIDQK